jgi:hypothetical protein
MEREGGFVYLTASVRLGAAEDGRAPTEELRGYNLGAFVRWGRPRTAALRLKSFVDTI